LWVILVGFCLPLTAAEVVVEHQGRRWFVENDWAENGRIVVRTFGRDHYSDEAFDERVFPGRLDSEKGRYYRLAKESLPAGFGEEDKEPSLEWYTLLPGIVVEDGSSRAPRLLTFGDAGIVTSGVSATLEVGEYISIKKVELEKKGFKLIVGPVCARDHYYRRLRSRVRFVVGKAAMKGPDMEVLEAAVRPWLEPVSLTQVAETCGPRHGALVRRWGAGTSEADIVAVLGEPSSRIGGELVFGSLRLRFEGGALVEVKTE